MTDYMDETRAINHAKKVLKQEREKIGLTIRQVAEETEVHSKTLQSMESEGSKWATARHILSLCEYYDLSLDYLFGLTKKNDGWYRR